MPHMQQSELRRDHELPFVVDDDPECVQRLAELIVAFATDILPAIGIVSSNERAADHLDVHISHQSLVMKALKKIKPAILVERQFDHLCRFTSSHTKLHRDGHTPPVSRRGLTALWRLHTAGADSAANMLLVNTRAGTVGEGKLVYIGSADPYTSPQTSELTANPSGYDAEHGGLSSNDLYHLLSNRSYEPLLCEPDVYHYQQPQFGSVLFKAVSSVGPSTIHAVRNVAGRRDVVTSMLTVVTR